MSGPGLLPAVIVLPVAGGLMLVIAAHLMVAVDRIQPPSRRRIRLANGCVMLLAVPMLAIGFSVIDPDVRSAEWVLVWITAISLLSLSVLLAGLDALNTLRILVRTRARIRGVLHELAELSEVHTQAPMRGSNQGDDGVDG